LLVTLLIEGFRAIFIPQKVRHVIVRFEFNHVFCSGDTVLKGVTLGSKIEVDLTDGLGLLKDEISWADLMETLSVSKSKVDNSLIFSETLLGKGNINVKVRENIKLVIVSSA
jgi:hypothetical protein